VRYRVSSLAVSLSLSSSLWVSLSLLLPAAGAAATDHEGAAVQAEQAGDTEAAFHEYVAAVQALPDPPPAEADVRLREHVVALALKLGHPVDLPPDAPVHVEKAQSLLEAQATLGSDGDTGGLEAAAAELRQAVRLAPWWPDATYMLAAVQQKLKQYDRAAANLRLYRLTMPSAPSAPGPAAAPSGAPSAGARAIVYAYWPHQFAGSGNPNRLDCDGQTVAKLQKGRFVRLSVAPGSHTFEFGQAVATTLEANQEYYLRAQYEGFPKRKALRLVPREQGVAEMQAGPVTAGDADHVFDGECRGASMKPAPGGRK